MKFKSVSSNPRLTSSNPRVTSSNPWAKSSNSRVTSLITRFTSSNPRIIKSIKIQVNSLKSSSFPKILRPKLFGNSWGNSYFQFMVIISCFTLVRPETRKPRKFRKSLKFFSEIFKTEFSILAVVKNPKLGNKKS